jgi:hypothetical protein
MLKIDSEEVIRGIIIRTNGKVEDFFYTGYESLRDGVGGLIETIITGWGDTRWDLWGNEEARLLGLPINIVGMKFVANASDRDIRQIVSLHGDMIILGVDDEGDSIGCPEATARLAKSFAMFDEPTIRFTALDEDEN